MIISTEEEQDRRSSSYYGLFPDDESDQQLQEILENLLVEAKVPDDTCLMMESERIFLSLLKSDSEESDGRKENLKEREDFDVLINLKYLSMIYEMISEMGSTWAELSKAKFRIKHWKHNCPEEQSGSQGDQEVICMDDNNISRERTKDTSAIQDFWTGSSIFPKDIYLHKVGHICPDRSSVASAAQQKSCSYLPEITQSWVKSYLWQTSGHQQPVSQVRVLDKMDHSGSSEPDSLRMLAHAVKGNSEKAPASGEGDSDGISQSHQIRTAGNPLRPQACWEPGCFLFVQICSRSSGSFASSADNFFSWLPPEQYNMQSVPQGRLDISLDTNRVIPSFSVRKRVCQPLSRTALEHAAVCEMVLLKEDLRTLQTVAHPACLKEALGSLWQTHTVVLTGVLRSKGHRFRCIQLDGKLYVNWGECLQAFSLAQADDIYQLACLLHIFLYRIPDEVTDHLRKYYGGEYRMLRSNPWVCLPSFYAMYHFCTLQVKLPHEALACGKQLHKVFIDLKPDSAMFPTCVLLKKGEKPLHPTREVACTVQGGVH
nr:hypothetical protein BaRGS_000583 [Batillaria attramentaria]